MKMKRRGLVAAVCLGATVSFLLVIGCTKKNATAPDGANEAAATVMQRYFPLTHGDSWTWEVIPSGFLVEEYADGDSSLGEPYTDNNQNGIFDHADTYEDLNENGRYDGPNVPWTPSIPYADRNGNGEYDAPNGFWDEGELFLDMDGNGVWSWACTLTMHASVLYPYPQDEVMFVGGQFLGTYCNGEPGGTWAELDLYSNDTSGLRWHGHIDWEDTRDFLGELCEPIVIAKQDPEVGDAINSLHCSLSWTWLHSSFQGIEDVSVPAGEFKDCFKFQFYATGWDWSMDRFNGYSYRWYAKDVGLVKSTGPDAYEYRVLKSAFVGGASYP